MPQPYETSPAQDHAAVTPSNSTVFSPPFRALYIGGAGNIVVTSIVGKDVTYTVPAGCRLDIAGKQVKATGTTATAIVALF